LGGGQWGRLPAGGEERAVAVAVATKAALSPVQSVGKMWEKSGKIIGFPMVSYGFLWFPVVSYGFLCFPMVSGRTCGKNLSFGSRCSPIYGLFAAQFCKNPPGSGGLDFRLNQSIDWSWDLPVYLDY